MASAAAPTAPGGEPKAKTEPGADRPEAPPLTGFALFSAAFALALSNFIVVLDSTIANVSIPHIAGGLAISPTQGTWAITSYAVADAISVPLTGWLSYRFGSVRLFLMAILGFGLFSFLCGMSGSLSALVVFRVLQGLSGGPLMPLTQTLMLRIFPKNQAPIALTIWAMTTTTAPIVGPILGGYISDDWSWPWIFFMNLPLIPICYIFVSRLRGGYETPIKKSSIDLGGLALLVLAVGSFQVMLDTGRDAGWFDSSWIVMLAIVAVMSFFAFIIWELTTSNPIVDIRVLANRGFAAATAALSLGYAAFFASLVLLPLWLQSVIGYTATQSGLTTMWIGFLAVMLSPVAAQSIGKVDVRLTVSLGIVWLGVCSLVRTTWTADSGYWTYAFPQMIQGAGMPFYFIGLTSLALGSVAAKDTVSAAGLMSFMRTLSGAIGTAVATSAWDDSGRVARSEIASTMNNVGNTMSQLQTRGFSVEQSRAAVDRVVEVQATTVGMIHIFVWAAAAFFIAAGLVWLAPKPKLRGGPPAGH